MKPGKWCGGQWMKLIAQMFLHVFSGSTNTDRQPRPNLDMNQSAPAPGLPVDGNNDQIGQRW
jgi:hypothetical protein